MLFRSLDVWSRAERRRSGLSSSDLKVKKFKSVECGFGVDLSECSENSQDLFQALKVYAEG